MGSASIGAGAASRALAPTTADFTTYLGVVVTHGREQIASLGVPFAHQRRWNLRSRVFPSRPNPLPLPEVPEPDVP